MIHFDFLAKSDKDKLLPMIFEILYSNMSVIAPTGNEREADYQCWYGAVSAGLERDARQIILIYDDDRIIGFFQYYVNETTFMMEEFQLLREYQGKGIFQRMYAFLYDIIPESTLYIEAYSQKPNLKSQGILKHLGLNVVGENKNGISYHFRGDCREVLSKYKKA